MRKAFDTHVAKLKPRLKTGVEVTETEIASETLPDGRLPVADPELISAELEVTPTEAPMPEPVAVAKPPAPVRTKAARTAPANRSNSRTPAVTRSQPMAAAPPAAVEVEEFPNGAVASLAVASDLIADRKERLEKIKRRVAEAARTPLRSHAPPPTPMAARESAIGLVNDLEGQLSRSRLIEDALRDDLKAARTELARTASEAKGALERLAAVERLIEEKQGVMSEMLAEMNALEEERDEAVQRAQALTALDQERQQVLDDVTEQLDGTRKACDTAQAEASRLTEELEIRSGDAARLRSALAEVTRERDSLARESNEVRRERDELLETRRALEQVHMALATARSKIA